MEDFIVCAYYTPLYKEEALQLMDTCLIHSINFWIEPLPDLGSWDKNTHFKPKFIQRCLEKFNKPILYVDADARFMKYPEMFHNIQADVSYFKGDVWGRGHEETVSATIYLKPNERVFKLLKQWEELCNQELHINDQELLAMELGKNYVSQEILPIEYCAIFDSPMISGKDPIILQTQASRRLTRR